MTAVVGESWSDLFTVVKLIARARELAAANPGRRYRGLFHPDAGQPHRYYSRGMCDDGSCGCWFGQALLSLGVPEEHLREEDAIGPRTITAMLTARGFARLEEADYLWLAEAQGRQDAGCSWGLCVIYADGRVSEWQERNPTPPSTQE